MKICDEYSVVVIPVHEFMPAALAAVLRKAPLTPEKVAFAWRAAVGVVVDKATSVELRDGVLHVAARDKTWRREVERSAAMIRARLDALLGAGVVRRVEVTAAPKSSPWEGGSGTGRRGR